MASETVLRPAWQARELAWVCRSKTVISFNYGALSVVILSRLFVFASFLFLTSFSSFPSLASRRRCSLPSQGFSPIFLFVGPILILLGGIC